MYSRLLTLEYFLDLRSNHLTRPVTPPSSIGPWRPPYRDRLLSTSCRSTPLAWEKSARGYTIPVRKVKPLSYFCQEMPPAILKMGRYSEMRTQPIMPPTTIIRMGLMALVKLSVAASTY